MCSSDLAGQHWGNQGPGTPGPGAGTIAPNTDAVSYGSGANGNASQGAAVSAGKSGIIIIRYAA